MFRRVWTSRKLALAALLAIFAVIPIKNQTTASAASMADRVSPPLRNIPWVLTQRFKCENCFGPHVGFHLGDDVAAPAGTPVYAVAAGIVKSTNVRTAYGNVVLIESHFPNETVVFVYGHLRSDVKVNVGQSVEGGQKATLLGYLGDLSQNGGYAPHIHFGVHRGVFFDGNVACNGAKVWNYAGYTTCRSIPDNDWYDPTEFIRNHLASGHRGDFNNDGWIDNTDYQLIKKAIGTYNPLMDLVPNNGRGSIDHWDVDVFTQIRYGRVKD